MNYLQSLMQKHTFNPESMPNRPRSRRKTHACFLPLICFDRELDDRTIKRRIYRKVTKQAISPHSTWNSQIHAKYSRIVSQQTSRNPYLWYSAKPLDRVIPFSAKSSTYSSAATTTPQLGRALTNLTTDTPCSWTIACLIPTISNHIDSNQDKVIS